MEREKPPRQDLEHGFVYTCLGGYPRLCQDEGTKNKPLTFFSGRFSTPGILNGILGLRVRPEVRRSTWSDSEGVPGTR